MTKHLATRGTGLDLSGHLYTIRDALVCADLCQFGYALEGVFDLMGESPIRSGRDGRLAIRRWREVTNFAGVPGVEGCIWQLGDDAGRNVQ